MGGWFDDVKDGIGDAYDAVKGPVGGALKTFGEEVLSGPVAGAMSLGGQAAGAYKSMTEDKGDGLPGTYVVHPQQKQSNAPPSPPSLEDQISGSLGLNPEKSAKVKSLMGLLNQIESSPMSAAQKALYKSIISSQLSSEMSSAAATPDPTQTPQYAAMLKYAQDKQAKEEAYAGSYADSQKSLIEGNARLDPTSKAQQERDLPAYGKRMTEKASQTADDIMLQYLESLGGPATPTPAKASSIPDYLGILNPSAAAQSSSGIPNFVSG